MTQPSSPARPRAAAHRAPAGCGVADQAGDTSARGKAVVNLVQLSSERKLVAVMPVRDFAEEIYLTMVTRNGVIKKSYLAD